MTRTKITGRDVQVRDSFGATSPGTRMVPCWLAWRLYKPKSEIKPIQYVLASKTKVAELTYAELTQGRESTRLPHTHKFTSLKNVVISALHKIHKRIHIQA